MTLTRDVPVVFLSYDEPYADANFERLKRQVPGALRVHGVKGFDAVHKEAAKQAGADLFITVDADNVVLDKFWDVDLDAMPDHFVNKTLSWRAFNSCNGLQYGNGGLKLWSSKYVNEMVTHERTLGTDNVLVDFCWSPEYVQLQPVYSVCDFTSSPFHSWRAGLREGVKMLLKEGAMADDPRNLIEHAYRSCVTRVVQWASMGRGQGFGGWSMLGTIEGIFYIHVKRTMPLETIMDYEGLKQSWHEMLVRKFPDGVCADPFADKKMRAYIDDCINQINAITGLYLPVLGPVQSNTVREWLVPTYSRNPFEEDSWNTIQW